MQNSLPIIVVVLTMIIALGWFLNQYLLWQGFAGEGLRTLAIAYRDLDDKYFKEWHKMLEDASIATHERDERIAGLYEEIEQDLMVRVWKHDSLCLQRG